MGRSDLKAKIRLEGDAKGADRAIKSVDKGFKGLTRSLKTNALAITAALGSVLGVYKALEAGAERLGQRRALERTLSAQGIAIDDHIAKLQTLSNKQIATSDLILASNRALALGIRSDDLPGLLEAATKASVSLGISATQAFNDITTGVGRASPLILDNLGIVVDAVKVYADYAASIGVSTEALTKQQKTIALSAAVMENAAKGAEDFAKAQSNVKVALDQSKTALKEFYESAIEAVVQNEGLGSTLQGLIEDFKNLAGAVRGYDKALKENAKGIEDIRKSHADWRDLLDLITLNISFATRAVLAYGKGVRDLEAIQAEAAESEAKVNARFQEKADLMYRLLGITEKYGTAQEEAAARTARIEAGLVKEATALSKLAAALGEVTQLELERELHDITAALEEARNSTDASSDAFVRYEQIANEKIDLLKTNIQRLRDGLGVLEEAADGSAKSFDELGDSIDDTGDAAEETGRNFDGLTRSVRDTNTALADQSRQARATRSDLQQLTAVAEALALAEARTQLAATQAARKRITGVSSQRDSDDLSQYALSPFGTGGRYTIEPSGNLRPA